MYEPSAEPPPWEIERAQVAVRNALDRGWFTGPVLDVGCGTGCNAILLATSGIEVIGVDIVPRAIERARGRAKHAGVEEYARFEMADACDLVGVLRGVCAKSVLDCGFCHVLSDADRPRYAAQLLRCTEPGASLVFLNFSEHEVRGGPRRMTINDYSTMLGSAFRLVDSIASTYESTAHEGGARAWLLRYLR